MYSAQRTQQNVCVRETKWALWRTPRRACPPCRTFWRVGRLLWELRVLMCSIPSNMIEWARELKSQILYRWHEHAFWQERSWLGALASFSVSPNDRAGDACWLRLSSSQHHKLVEKSRCFVLSFSSETVHVWDNVPILSCISNRQTPRTPELSSAQKWETVER